MKYVHDAIGKTLSNMGVKVVFGVVGSGNFHFTQALVEGGARFVAARHEGGAASMADAYARMSGEVAVLSLHQGCGYTNAITGVAEAAKSHTPLLVLTAEATDPRSNFFIDQHAIAESIGAVSMRVTSPESAVREVRAAFELCRTQSRTVVLNVPIDVQDMVWDYELPDAQAIPETVPPQPVASELEKFADLLLRAERPVFIAGRGARSLEAKSALRELAVQSGALLATSAVAKGLFNGDPWNIDVSGGFSSPLTAELISSADLVVSWGCTLNMWTTRHGKLLGDGADLVQVDLEQSALGKHRAITLGLWGDVAATAAATVSLIADKKHGLGYRTSEIKQRIDESLRWSQVPFTDQSGDGLIDPRVLSMRIDEMLPAERVVGVDSGNFLGYPSMFMQVPDENGFCFTQAFQAVGLGMATAIGAAVAQPDRVPVLATGDGGFLMGISELETIVRLGLPMVIIVYNDSKYGAEVHHFGQDAAGIDSVVFPPTDMAEIARGYGCEAITVREVDDLLPLKAWLDGSRKAPIVIDAKTVSKEAAWWLKEAFGH